VYASTAKKGAPVRTIRIRTNARLVTSMEYCGQFMLRERRSLLISCNEPTVAGLAPHRTIVRFDFSTPLPAYWKLPGWLPRFQRARYLFASHSDQQEFLGSHSLIPATSTTVIPYSVDLALFRPSPRGERSPLRAGFAGQWVHGKGCLTLLEAWKIVRQSFPEAELWFAGSDKLWKGTSPTLGSTEIAEKIREANAEGWAKIVGEYRRTEMADFWNALDIAVVPSYVEAFGLVALEALACGIPVVASYVGGLQEIVVDGDCGFLVPPADATKLAEAIIALLTNEELRSSMGKRARVRAETFSEERRMRDLSNLLSSRVEAP
jgi:glycosyltransferase involved in cell wall biosynthesis